MARLLVKLRLLSAYSSSSSSSSSCSFSSIQLIADTIGYSLLMTTSLLIILRTGALLATTDAVPEAFVPILSKI